MWLIKPLETLRIRICALLEATIGAGHRGVTKLGPHCKVKLWKNNGDKAVVRSPLQSAQSTRLVSFLAHS